MRSLAELTDNSAKFVRGALMFCISRSRNSPQNRPVLRQGGERDNDLVASSRGRGKPARLVYTRRGEQAEPEQHRPEDESADG